MIRWLWVLAQRLLSLCLVAVGGCWADEPLVHGSFTPEQWAGLQEVFKQPDAPDPCALIDPVSGEKLSDDECKAAATLGQQLFFEPRMSGPGTTSCATCHDPAPDPSPDDDAGGWYADTRAMNAVSVGASGTTKHNTISLVNVGIERELYTWIGDCNGIEPCQTPTNVVHDIALPGPAAMDSNANVVACAIRIEPSYVTNFEAAFHLDPVTLPATIVEDYAELALDAYMRRLVSLASPFDRFIRGDDSALDEAQTRGFALFVGRAMCAECHRGGLLSDNQPHVTGVPGTDMGFANTGAFLTPGLRNVDRTSPYMHDGSLGSLAKVIEFYRKGGAASGYVGDKDPLIAPLDITDDEAKDLEAFLHTLTGENIIGALRKDTHVVTTLTPARTTGRRAP